MLGILAGIALLATAPLAAAPILIDGYGWTTGGGWGHVNLSGEGVFFSLALVTGTVFGNGPCRAGELCALPIEGGGGAGNPSDAAEVTGTYLGQTITPDTFAEATVSFHGSVAVHGYPFPSSEHQANVPGSADWTGLIRIWPGGYGTAGIEFKFAGTGPAQAFLEFQPNVYSEDLCPAPPGGWTEPPPESCFYTNFLVRGVEGTFTGTLEEVPEPSTWTALGAGLMAVIGAAARRRKRGHRKIE